jgi:demethylmenaquinone methyltransferase/2-methoxy-6-polyprenyl-1,4-benzoquinol methylase
VRSGPDDLLAGQRDYYRARAASYERDLYTWDGAAQTLTAVVARVPAGGTLLELACGTGVWTERLLSRASAVTAVDAAPEMIAIARERAGAAEFVVADLFEWSPQRRYDTVFFGFWLSHVPADRFVAFWQCVRSALADGGRVVFVDEHVIGQDKETWLGADVALRTLPDGSEHRIVKTYIDPESLQRRLAELGWRAEIEPLAAGAWVLGVAQPAG